jgi:hypothetical protein
MELQNADRVTVGSWEISDPTGSSDPGDVADWRLTNDLYTGAHRTAAGWDVVLSDVKAALQRPGSIGASRVTSRASTATEEDIPF